MAPCSVTPLHSLCLCLLLGHCMMWALSLQYISLHCAIWAHQTQSNTKGMYDISPHKSLGQKWPFLALTCCYQSDSILLLRLCHPQIRDPVPGWFLLQQRSRVRFPILLHTKPSPQPTLLLTRATVDFNICENTACYYTPHPRRRRLHIVLPQTKTLTPTFLPIPHTGE